MRRSLHGRQRLFGEVPAESYELCEAGFGVVIAGHAAQKERRGGDVGRPGEQGRQVLPSRPGTFLNAPVEWPISNERVSHAGDECNPEQNPGGGRNREQTLAANMKAEAAEEEDRQPQRDERTDEQVTDAGPERQRDGRFHRERIGLVVASGRLGLEITGNNIACRRGDPGDAGAAATPAAKSNRLAGPGRLAGSLAT